MDSGYCCNCLPLANVLLTLEACLGFRTPGWYHYRQLFTKQLCWKSTITLCLLRRKAGLYWTACIWLVVSWSLHLCKASRGVGTAGCTSAWTWMREGTYDALNAPYGIDTVVAMCIVQDIQLRNMSQCTCTQTPQAEDNKTDCCGNTDILGARDLQETVLIIKLRAALLCLRHGDQSFLQLMQILEALEFCPPLNIILSSSYSLP